MAAQATDQVYLCARCLLAGDAPGPCPRCGQERLTCRPGSADDPCRRPWIDGQGRIRTRAPLWWLKQTIGGLADALATSAGGQTQRATLGRRPQEPNV
jgi:hypothetical protein